jgi:uncharacterized protein (TIGR02145 family)
MKTKTTTTWIFLLAFAAAMMIITSSCSKSSSDSSTPAATTVSDIDGNVYHYVTIGTQVWMVENLKTTRLNDGTAIPWVSDTSWQSLSSPAYCYYSNDITWKDIYGKLYNWWAVNTGKLAPAGWHVPTDAEWTTLITYLGSDSIAGGKLKSTGTVESITGLWFSPNTGATNTTGFTAYPGGYRFASGVGFKQINMLGYWWTSTEFGTSTAYDYFMRFDDTNVHHEYSFKNCGYSVRCIKN